MKQRRTLRTGQEIERMKAQVAQFPTAKKIAEEIVAHAEIWAGMEDQFLHELPPPADIYRGFQVSFGGCPIHGEAVFRSPGGPWKADVLKRPWKIQCSVGGEEYPSNDFMAFYQTKDRSLLTGEFADDGTGWDPKDGRAKFWFVAHYCFHLWHQILPALKDLGRAYLLTGEARFGRKGAILLDRLATLFPTMDYATQSWYGLNYLKGYTGRFLYAVQESFNIALYAEAYDNLFPALQEDRAVHAFLNKGPQELVRHVEENLVRQCVRDIWEGKIRGNYGLHQASAVKALVAIDDPAFTAWALDGLKRFTGAGPTTAVWAYGVEGWNHALDNFLFRDGVSFEVAIGYSAGCWTKYMLDTDLVLAQLGAERLPEAHVRALGNWPRRLACWNGKMPAIADTGAGVMYPPIDLSAMQRFYRGYRWPEYARVLLDAEVTGEKSFTDFEDLFQEPLTKEDLEKAAHGIPRWPDKSDNLGGVGFAILRSGQKENQLAAVIQYGRANAGHAHRDRLNLEVIAGGKPVVPDTGYPTHAAEHPDPPAWEKNTISHVTVVVNERRQDTNDEGQLERFAALPHVQHIDVSSPRAYLNVKTYRRTVTLLELAPDVQVLVDLFRVKGGWGHDYSFHGFDGKFSTVGVNFQEQHGGTLAGPEVPYGRLYDDPQLEEHAKMLGPPGTNGKRSFSSYRGSGFSYLFNVKRGKQEGVFQADWKEDGIGFQMMVPPHGAQEIIAAHGKPPNKPGNPEQLQYILLRNRADQNRQDLESLFAVVCEAYRKTPRVTEVNRLEAKTGKGVALKISWDGGTCWLISGEDDAQRCAFEGGLELEGGFGVINLNHHGQPLWACVSGKSLRYGNAVAEGAGIWEGTILSVDYETCQISVASQSNHMPHAGETLLVNNGVHVCNFPIAHATQNNGHFVFKLDRLCIGRFVVEAETPDGLLTQTWVHREWEDTADSGTHYLKGARLAYKGKLYQIEKVMPRPGIGGHQFVLRDAIPWPNAPEDQPVIYDLGPGDKCRVRPTIFKTF